MKPEKPDVPQFVDFILHARVCKQCVRVDPNKTGTYANSCARGGELLREACVKKVKRVTPHHDEYHCSKKKLREVMRYKTEDSDA